MNMYAIHDTTAKSWAAPFFQRTDVAAIRAMAAAVNTEDRNNQLFTNPEDFNLYHVGTFNEETGTVSADSDMPKLIVNGIKLKKEIK